MFKKFKTKELIFIAIMAALLFVINFVIGAWIVAATGVPGSSVLITGISNLIILTFVSLVIRKFGAATFLYFIYSIITLPTHLSGGPPGFLPKIPLMILLGLAFDIPNSIAKYRKIGFVFGMIAISIAGVILYPLAYWLFDIPSLDKLIALIPIALIAYFVLGSIGIWLGFLLHKKLKNKHIFKQIRN